MKNFDVSKHRDDLLFIALGGASEIGMNLNLYQKDGKWIMIDCGVGFGYNIPGIDMLAPDISFIKQHRKDLLGIVITHIHEDHLGAVQYLWEQLRVPVYTSNLAANFLRSKLSEFKLENTVKINVVDGSKNVKIGPFDLEFIGLTHSVPEMNAILIKTESGNVLHTGDWKFDPDPVVGNVSEKEKIARYGESDEVLAMVCDSTNAVSQGHSRSEGELLESLTNIVKDCDGMVGVSTFASNIARIETITRVAKATGRKVILAGFSLHRIYEVGKQSGYFADCDVIISEHEAKYHAKNELLLIMTGCQGEPMAATRKIASGIHPLFSFGPRDTVIFSSKIIPGNEKKIGEVFNLFAKRMVNVVTERDKFVHVSGHPSSDELEEMYKLSKPKIAIPVHGEFLHIERHCEIAKDSGVEKVVQTENGSVVRISKDLGRAEVIGKVNSGYFGIDGFQLLDLKGETIKQRYKMRQAGAVFISIAMSENLKIIGRPQVISLGAYDFPNDVDALRYLENEIATTFNGHAKSYLANSGSGILKGMFGKKKHGLKAEVLSDLTKKVRSRAAKIMEEMLGKRPIVEVVIHYTP